MYGELIFACYAIHAVKDTMMVIKSKDDRKPRIFLQLNVIFAEKKILTVCGLIKEQD